MKMFTPAALVAQEVGDEIGDLVRAMADACDELTDGSRLAELCNMAFELFEPVPDYDISATDEGWEGPLIDQRGLVYFSHTETREEVFAADREELCMTRCDIFVTSWNVVHVWTVSNWLAHRLEEKGARVVWNFQGLNLWAQVMFCSPAQDCVIEEITAELNAETAKLSPLTSVK